MKKSSVEELSATLVQMARPKMSPRELLAQVRERHPKASKKAIARAAFYSIISSASADADTARSLQALALAGRAGD